jgi:hypothetical protein
MMRRQVPSVVAAFTTLAAFYLVGVLLLLDPVASQDVVSESLLPLCLAFFIAIAVHIALFVWLERAVGDSFPGCQLSCSGLGLSTPETEGRDHAA